MVVVLVEVVDVEMVLVVLEDDGPVGVPAGLPNGLVGEDDGLLVSGISAVEQLLRNLKHFD